MRQYGQRLRRAVAFERVAWLRHLPVRADLVLYESFAGNGMLCNPEAIFRALLADERFAHLHHVWTLADLDAYASTVAEFADDPRVTFVAHGSGAYHRALATAAYLVNNATFSPLFSKRAGQVYLNTWHGTPLKSMGYDVPGGAVEARNVLRNFAGCDYLLAPNDATSSMYLDAYRLRNLYRGGLIHAGTPRVDRQFADPNERAATVGRLRAGGTALPDGREIVLYAPTWRGEFQSPTDDIALLRSRVDELQARLDPERFRVLLKVHQQVYRHAVEHAGLRSMLVGNEVPTNAVLALVDVLVTDYSSIVVDHLATGRPVLFLAPDLDDYAATRGLNLPPEQWPGPVCAAVDDLAARIAALGSGGALDPLRSHADRYAAARERFCADEDGGAAGRVIDAVFGGDPQHVETGFADGRPSVLIYLGGLLPNGITTSALSLLDSIDHDRVDVSVFYDHTENEERVPQLARIHPRVRLFPRVGGMVAHKLRVRLIKARGRRPASRSHADDVMRHRAALLEEWRRCFGDARFDHVVDFSGYSPFWDKLLLQGGAPSVSLWQHNDLAADAERLVDGRHPHRANLHAVFDLYRYADHLVSVSPALAGVNRARLARYAPPEKFVSARNTVDHRRILRGAYGLADAHPAMTDAAQRPSPGSPAGGGVRTLVSVGRLSPEKNHARLIRAFAVVHRQEPDTRLVILGSGPLLADLQRLVAELGLAAAVTLAGHRPDPYAVLAQADCFVLSSDYEGQPMVILEALVVGLPVVTTSFATVADAVPAGCGLVVGADVEPLAAGMLAVLRGEVDFGRFDYVRYNAGAVAEFYRAIGLPD